MFQPGRTYTKKDIYNVLEVSTVQQLGSWNTGYHFYGNDAFIFANVNIAGRTGHNYDNHWHDNDFVWFGKTGSHIAQPSIQKLLNPAGKVYIFTRTDDRAPFHFEGEGHAIGHSGSNPISITWGFGAHPTQFPEEVDTASVFYEGAVKTVIVNRYERSTEARRACLAHYGFRCMVCDFSFEETYGSKGAGFIHVHHLVPLASIGEQYSPNPITDLRPVCPNCHAMLHRTNPPMDIDSLRSAIGKA